MNYTHSITSKGQITLPKEFRDKLGFGKDAKATLSLNNSGEIIISRPKDLKVVRAMLQKPTFKDAPSAKERSIGAELAKKYGVS